MILLLTYNYIYNACTVIIAMLYSAQTMLLILINMFLIYTVRKLRYR